MGFPLVATGVGMLGATAGAKAEQALGGAVGGDGSSGDQTGVAQLVNQMNGILTKSLSGATNTATNYTNQAVNQQNTSLGNSTAALNQALQAATGAANSNVAQGQATGQAIQQPYMQTGYNAMDALNDSLGLSRPTQGSASVANALQQKASATPMISQLQQLGTANPNAPTLDTYLNGISQQQINDYVNQNISQTTKKNSAGGKFNWLNYTGAGADPAQDQVLLNNVFNGSAPGTAGHAGSMNDLTSHILGDPNQVNAIKNALAQPLFNTATQQYDQTQGQQGQLLQQLQQLGYTPQQQGIAAAATNGLFQKATTPTTLANINSQGGQ